MGRKDDHAKSEFQRIAPPARRLFFEVLWSMVPRPPLCLLLAMLSLAGCNRSGLMEQSGQVTLDGDPVPTGTISFFPADGRGPTAANLIVDGQYTVKAAPGPKRVEIHGYRIVGQAHYIPGDPSSPLVDQKDPIVPERYNVKSELTCQVKRSRSDLHFVLSSQE